MQENISQMNTVETNMFIAAAVRWWVAQLPSVSAENLTAFKKACEHYITKKYSSPQHRTLVLSADFTPDTNLSAICVEAGINPLRVAFTQKAVMVLNFDTMTITCSTGNDEQEVLLY